MKNRLLTGILLILLGAFIAFGPQTVFPVCGVRAEGAASSAPHGDEMPLDRSG